MQGRHILPNIAVGDHHNGSFRVYMQHKNAKLEDQFNVQMDQRVSDIFQGKVFTVNGRVDPPLEEIRRLVVNHGGQFDLYQTSRVTHVVCTHLPHTKMEKLQKRKRVRPGTEVLYVLPTFVTDSVAIGKLLPHADYIIDGLRNHYGASIDRSLKRGEADNHYDTKEDRGGGEAEEEDAIKVDERGGHRKVPTAPHHGPHLIELSPSSTSLPTLPQPPPGQHTPEPTPPSVPSQPSKSRPSQPQILGFSSPSETTKSQSGGNDSGNKRLRSTKEDEDFIPNFFNSSRLHFIGAYRSHLQGLVAEKTMAMGRTGREHPLVGKKAGERVVIHIDMDCFFVSVLLRDRQELADKPVAVAHTGNTRGAASSEISSCNYAARAKGVRASMWMGQAKELCPELVVLPYDFDAYQKVSDQIYSIFLEETVTVQPVSCDEAYLEMPPGTDGEEVTRHIRRRIMQETRCPASAGIGPNMLVARLATKRAKPNGQLWVREKDVVDFVKNLSLSDLPGVGWSLTQRLEQEGLRSCLDCQPVPLSKLQSLFGVKTGQMLWEACRGQDDRQLQTNVVRKSLGADVNWGVRFSQDDQVREFLGKLSLEVERRLAEAKVKGRCITLRVKESQYGPGEPEKLLGCGLCHNHSRSVTLPKATANGAHIKAAVLRMYADLDVPAELVRGLGIQLSKLEADGTGDEATPTLLTAWLLKEREGTVKEGAEGSTAQDEDHWSKDPASMEFKISSSLTTTAVPQEAGVRSMPPPAAAKTSTMSAEVPRYQMDPHVPSELPPQLRKEVSGDTVPKKHDLKGAEERLPLHPARLSQIDPTAFQALPIEIQREFEEEFAIMSQAGDEDVSSRPGPGSPTRHHHVRSKFTTRGVAPHRSSHQASMFQYHQLQQMNEEDQRELRVLPLKLRFEVAERPDAYLRKKGWQQEEEEGRGRDMDQPVGMGLFANMISNGPAQVQEEEKDSRNFFEDEELGKVKTALMQWLSSIREPGEAHLQLVALFLVELVSKGGRLEEVDLLLRAFHRLAHTRRVWQHGYQAIQKAVECRIAEHEQGFRCQYGGSTLSAPSHVQLA